jgi:uncharacterized protein
VILLDANVLIYAYDETFVQHGAARRWLEDAFIEHDEIAIPLVSLLAFLRVMTNPGLFGEPMSVAQGAEIVSEWLARPNVGLAQPTRRHFELVAELARTGRVRGSMLMDAHLAALALEHGATLCTTDRDLARFKGLRLEDPIGSE